MYSKLTPRRGRSVVLAPPWCQVGAPPHEHRAGVHLGRRPVLTGGRELVVAPAVAARDDPGGAVGLGERVDGPHAGDHDLRVGAGQGIDGVVGVQALRRLAGADGDGEGHAQLVVADQGVDGASHQGVEDEHVGGPGLGQQAERAPGREALEVVAAQRASRRPRAGGRCGRCRGWARRGRRRRPRPRRRPRRRRARRPSSFPAGDTAVRPRSEPRTQSGRGGSDQTTRKVASASSSAPTSASLKICTPTTPWKALSGGEKASQTKSVSVPKQLSKVS